MASTHRHEELDERVARHLRESREQNIAFGGGEILGHLQTSAFESSGAGWTPPTANPAIHHIPWIDPITSPDSSGDRQLFGDGIEISSNKWWVRITEPGLYDCSLRGNVSGVLNSAGSAVAIYGRVVLERAQLVIDNFPDPDTYDLPPDSRAPSDLDTTVLLDNLEVRPPNSVLSPSAQSSRVVALDDTWSLRVWVQLYGVTSGGIPTAVTFLGATAHAQVSITRLADLGAFELPHL